jgi:signal transduction histidine kinase/ActR/RegA family two-component response regulator
MADSLRLWGRPTLGDRSEGLEGDREEDTMLRHVERGIARMKAPLAVKLQIAFLILIGVLLATALVSLLAIAGIREGAVSVNSINRSLEEALGLDHSIVLQEHLSSMFLLTADESYSEKLVTEQQRFRELLGELRAHGATSAEIAAIADASNRYERATATVRALRRAGDERQAQQTHVEQEHTIAHEIEGLTKALAARMKTLQQARHDEMQAAQVRANWTVAGFFVLAVLLALLLGPLLARSIVDPVRRVDAALERIAGGQFVSVSDVVNGDEIGSLVSNVNGMSQRLADLYAKERQTAQTLQEQLVALSRTQAQLRQAQKMDAIGRLAGGVAHDFNNLLTVIGGRAHGVLVGLTDDRKRRDVELILKTTDRAAALTRQLLAFSRKQVLQPRVIDLNELVAGIVPMLQRLIGEHIALATHPGRDLGLVKADPTQIEQVILNLVVNARDAMPEGGILSIETENAKPGEKFGSDEAVGPGVKLMVRDSGVGMSPETQAHLFEPFFTTKDYGRGTGLGLATVYGIVNQSDGYVAIGSELGRGTTVTIWLPLADDTTDGAPASELDLEPSRGHERILLVEDGADVRNLARDVLEQYGYTVLEAKDGEEALRVEAETGTPPDLVLTDIVMPNLGGRELVRQLRARRPHVKVLYMSGYADDALGGHVLEPGANLLQKPFTPEQLALSVRRILDGLSLTTAAPDRPLV